MAAVVHAQVNPAEQSIATPATFVPGAFPGAFPGAKQGFLSVDESVLADN